jgi:hypothetical protein
MRATIIKLEPDLHEKVRSLKAPEQSATAYVRDLIEREFGQRQQRAAAEAHQSFLQAHPEERAQLEAWEQAHLGEGPQPVSASL